MMYKTDYHIHSVFSDGRSEPGDYIEAARSAGLKEIGFAEHLTLFRDNLDWSMGRSQVGPYLKHIRGLSSRTERIKVRTGLEVDFLPGKESEIYSFINTLDIDYALGSVHYMGDNTVDLGPEFYEGKNFDTLFMNYFDTVAEAAASGIFDIIGHCDLIRIYGFKPSFDPEPVYTMLAKAFRKYDVAFEVNTNGRNRPLADFYPDRRFLHIFRKENVPVCVNSDAHMPQRVAQYFDEAYELVREAGYTEMAVFDKRQRFMIPM
jgi:histidinol-phosphatase (PHP family)